MCQNLVVCSSESGLITVLSDKNIPNAGRVAKKTPGAEEPFKMGQSKSDVTNF